jgi:hypothetical protein
MPKNCPFKFLSRFCPRKLSGLTREQKLRVASESCVAGGAVSLAASVLVWIGAGRGEARARGERLGIFMGLWVPSLLLTAAYLTRKADEEAISRQDEIPFYEEFM